MDYRTRTLAALRTRPASAATKLALVGFDGFVDRIVHPVGTRHGQGDAFTPMAAITEFGNRVLAAAGKSTNIELYPVIEKLGGNGPIMTGALLAAGVPVRYVGALGAMAVHPVFAGIAQRTEAASLCDPGLTIALEFPDGKVMLGLMKSLDEITYARIVAVMGEGAFLDLLSRADLTALVNWTMVPNMTAILEELAARVYPQLPPRERIFFFDLADPEKRSTGDLLAALNVIARFQSFGRVTLGLNLKEAQQVFAALGLGRSAEDEKALRSMAREIRQKLGIAVVVIHPRESAACATKDDTWWVPGPVAEKPLITTGAGDHFNAGFVTGQLLGLAPEACLGLGVSNSGYYVRTARSPSLGDLERFLA
ncbi:MAG: sugar kinase [Verrucomicrobia bacterium RIFCSPLOWO2_12_FULL_64_8]|nr:MAG: sugar kinase [Verrucomicrobia bacterium RIFCSPLOWO2_12_FULL_64_8]